MSYVHNPEITALLQRLLNPDDLGHAAGARLRDIVRFAFGRPSAETNLIACFPSAGTRHKTLQSALADDSLVIQYQTIGQYRSALLADFPLVAAGSQEAKPVAATGFVLVPVAPTGMMKDAGAGSLPLGAGPWNAADCYRAMLAVAPQEHAPEDKDAIRNATLEEAAAAVEDRQRKGREWVPGSLWDALSREAGTRIRALQARPQQGQS
jgi:hypothetical protein